MAVNTISLSQAVSSVHVDIGFSFETLDTLSDSLDTVNFNGDITLDRDAVVTKYNEIEAARPIKELREERDRLIAETDWWASSDLTMSAERSAYRQALRDITESYSSLDDVVWPTKPS